MSEIGENELLHLEFHFLSNFMAAKILFWFEFEMSVFWAIFLVMMMMMIEIKSWSR